MTKIGSKRDRTYSWSRQSSHWRTWWVPGSRAKWSTASSMKEHNCMR